MSFIEVSLSPLGVIMEGAMGILLLPRPIIDFIKVQIALWPSLGFRLFTKIAQACFFDLMMSLFFVASALFHAVLFSDDRGFIRHSFSAFLANATAFWQSLFHQGRRGSLGDLAHGFHWGHLVLSKI